VVDGAHLRRKEKESSREGHKSWRNSFDNCRQDGISGPSVRRGGSFHFFCFAGISDNSGFNCAGCAAGLTAPHSEQTRVASSLGGVPMRLYPHAMQRPWSNLDLRRRAGLCASQIAGGMAKINAAAQLGKYRPFVVTVWPPFRDSMLIPSNPNRFGRGSEGLFGEWVQTVYPVCASSHDQVNPMAPSNRISSNPGASLRWGRCMRFNSKFKRPASDLTDHHSYPISSSVLKFLIRRTHSTPLRSRTQNASKIAINRTERREHQASRRPRNRTHGPINVTKQANVKTQKSHPGIQCTTKIASIMIPSITKCLLSSRYYCEPALGNQNELFLWRNVYVRQTTEAVSAPRCTLGSAGWGYMV